MNGSRLWAVACLFNPRRYASRARNFRDFRAHLEVPLLAVELTFDGHFELDQNDADILVRVDGGDVMWQKERLLNLGVCHLPPECEAVAMLDADVVFDNQHWPRQAQTLLESRPVVQLFSHAYYMPAGWRAPHSRVAAIDHQLAAGSAVRQERDIYAGLGPQPASGRGRLSPGFAWAFRRDLLDTLGLFDACIAGGGDTAIACASWGAFGAVEDRHAMTRAQRAFYRAWAEPWYERVRGKVGCVEGELRHLWHGKLEHRLPGVRHRVLASYEFDPAADLAIAGDGVWTWASDKPAMHRFLIEYFGMRREDE